MAVWKNVTPIPWSNLRENANDNLDTDKGSILADLRTLLPDATPAPGDKATAIWREIMFPALYGISSKMCFRGSISEPQAMPIGKDWKQFIAQSMSRLHN